MLFNSEMVSDRVGHAAEYLRLFVQFNFAVVLIGRAEEKAVLTLFEPAHKALAVHEGQNDVAVAVVAQPFDDEQILVGDLAGHCVPREAREEGRKWPWRQQCMQIQRWAPVFLGRGRKAGIVLFVHGPTLRRWSPGAR